jgi:uncharacterized protein (DUF305 family)
MATADRLKPADHALLQERRMKGAYRNLAIEVVIDGIIMFFVMYTMIDTIRHFHSNINTMYMTTMMVAPMVVVMIVAMRSMYPSKRLNIVISGIAVLVFIASFAAVRTQAAVGNVEFLRSMIPHHSGAILMCKQATITDPEIIRLCDAIVRSQRAEIVEMERILTRY